MRDKKKFQRKKYFRLYRLRWRKLKERFYRNLEQQILETKEKPQRVALGCALGIGVNFFPTFGFGFILAFFLATLLRVNRAIAAAFSILTGPLVPLLYALNFVSGGLILAEAAGKENLVAFVLSQYALLLKVGRIQEQILGALELFGSTFLLGASVNALLFGIALYFTVSYLLQRKIINPQRYRLK